MANPKGINQYSNFTSTGAKPKRGQKMWTDLGKRLAAEQALNRKEAGLLPMKKPKHIRYSPY